MTATPPIPTPQSGTHPEPHDADPRPTGRIGRIVAGSLITGLVLGLVFALSPFTPAEEGAVTGALLMGFALGWTMLAVLSARFTDQPQRWALAPALFLGASGLLLIVTGPRLQDVLDWVWPPALVGLAVWSFVKARQRLRSHTRVWLVYPLIAVMALAGIAGGLQTVRSAMDEGDFPMAGQLLDVGGHNLHLSCSGSGSPTVILEPGAGEMSSVMGWVAPAVARHTRVCVYDRAGRGWSEPADGPQDARQIAADLHTLLQQGRIAGPYVMAGHSFGGLYALTFAAAQPDDVAGMVLIDSTAPVATPPATAAGDERSTGVLDRAAALLASSARLGFGRLLGHLSNDGLPPQSRDEARASTATLSHVRSTIDEYLQGAASVQEAGALQEFGDKPLVVLTAGLGHDAAWNTAQDQLATLSSNSAHRVVEGTGHGEMVSDQVPAATTTQAVLDVVASIRQDRPLAE